MNYTEITKIIEKVNNLFPIIESSEPNNYLSINNVVSIPIIISTHFDTEENISIENTSGEELGTIFFAKEKIEEENMSETLYSVYLTDVDSSDFGNTDYKLKRNYLALKQERLQEYLQDYNEYSSIWGGFYPEKLHQAPKTIRTTKIKAIKNLTLPTEWHKQNMLRAIQQPYAFERFLKKYHLLELLFDWQIVSEIKDLELSNDLSNVGVILRNYSRKDIERLNYVLEKGINDYYIIASLLSKVETFMDTAKNIFYEYGKDSNPLKDYLKFEDIINIGGFSKTNLETKKLINRNKPFEIFIYKITAYWIYRIRSSIAHQKIGEYLMTSDDEDFVTQFCEPLIDEIIKQCFSDE